MSNRIEIDVNGISIAFDMASGVQAECPPLCTLLRKGDACEVDDGGIIRKGKVQNIISLSKGKKLFSVRLDNNPLKDWDLVEGEKVAPVDALQCRLRLTAFEMLLRKYEPTGQSTNVSLWN